MKQKSASWFYGKLPDVNTPDKVPGRPVTRDGDYLQIYLKSMHIGYARKGLTTYYAAVHSFISLLHRGGGTAQFNVVTKPGQLEILDAKRLYNVVNFNKALLGPIPYRGGRIDVEIGLFSIATSNLADPFISLLTEMSNVAGVSFISAALPFSEPIKKGIGLLTGSLNSSLLEIGLSTSYDDIETGYYIVMAAPKDKFQAGELYVTDDFSLADAHRKPIDEYPYIVFQVQAAAQRADWFNIPEIAKAYKRLKDDTDMDRDPDAQSVNDSFAAFRRALNTSPDLIRRDAEELFKQVQYELGEASDTTPTKRGGLASNKLPKVRRPLKDLQDYIIY